MDKLIIEGGTPLVGEVSISGAKNSALPLLASSLLTQSEHTFKNVPQLHDIKSMCTLLSELGVETKTNNQQVVLSVKNEAGFEAPYEMVRKMRASVLVMGPLLAKRGHAKISLPGGCAIGARPIDLHLKALEKMGATVELKDGYVELRCNKLRGSNIFFDTVTVTGTENIMMAASLASGTTTIENAAREPEICDLASYLRKMGANIEGDGSSRIVIHGVNTLNATTHEIIPDRIETGTFAVAAAITKGKLTIRNCNPSDLESFLLKLEACGVLVEKTKDTLYIEVPEAIKAGNITTAPHPGFPTDLQAQFMALMTQADGSSVITENIFENRFMHVPELVRMGAEIDVEGSCAFVNGNKKLKGAPVMATDLRASACLVLAALAAEGATEIRRIYHLDRGYETMEQKLLQLGAKIKRIANTVDEPKTIDQRL